MSKNFLDEVQKICIRQINQRVNTTYPALVLDTQEYEETQTITVQPLIEIEFEDGQIMRLQPISNVLVVLPGGGDFGITVPIRVGEVVPVFFCKRSLEEFLVADEFDFYSPIDNRVMSTSDCYAFPKLTNKKNNFNPHPENFEIKTLSGTFKLSVTPEGEFSILNGGGYFRFNADGSFDINGLKITKDGNLISSSGVNLSEHGHEAGDALFDGQGGTVLGVTGGPTSGGL